MTLPLTTSPPPPVEESEVGGKKKKSPRKPTLFTPDLICVIVTCGHCSILLTDSGRQAFDISISQAGGMGISEWMIISFPSTKFCPGTSHESSQIHHRSSYPRQPGSKNPSIATLATGPQPLVNMPMTLSDVHLEPFSSPLRRVFKFSLATQPI